MNDDSFNQRVENFELSPRSPNCSYSKITRAFSRSFEKFLLFLKQRMFSYTKPISKRRIHSFISNPQSVFAETKNILSVKTRAMLVEYVFIILS